MDRKLPEYIDSWLDNNDEVDFVELDLEEIEISNDHYLTPYQQYEEVVLIDEILDNQELRMKFKKVSYELTKAILDLTPTLSLKEIDNVETKELIKQIDDKINEILQ